MNKQFLYGLKRFKGKYSVSKVTVYSIMRPDVHMKGKRREERVKIGKEKVQT